MNRKLIPLIVLLILFCAFLCSLQSQRTEIQAKPSELVPKPEIREDAVMEIGTIDPAVDQRLQELLEEGGIPSFTVGIVIKDELVWAKSYNGVAGTDTVYIIGSVSKPFIATAILQLYERGLIDLDADINEYLPFPFRHPKFPDEPILVRTLLTHRSGLAMDTEDYIRFQNPDEVIKEYVSHGFGIDLPELNLEPYPSRPEFFKAFMTPGGEYYSKDAWPVTPGTYQYSNIGYGLLAYIIECITDGSVEEYLQTNILDPLEMVHSGAELTGLEAYHAHPYQRVQGEYMLIPFRGIPFNRFCETWDLGCVGKNLFSPGAYLPVPDDIDQYLESNYLRFPLYENLVGNGGVRASVPDLSKFMIAHMNGGRAPNGFQLLQPETVEMMHETAVPHEGSVNLIPMKGYGLGWTIAKDGIQGHIGGASGYEAEMLYKESSQGSYGIVFLRNWSWELADDYENGFDYWKKYHVGVREILIEEAERLNSSAVSSPKPGTELGSIDPEIDLQIHELVDEGEIPSLAVSLVVSDELVWAKGYGEQPDLSTVYMIGSIDKVFIGTAVMQLYEQDKIRLKADVNDYLPFDVRHPDYPDKPVTIQMLLTHESGLAHDFPDAFYYENDQDMLAWASKNLDIDLDDLPPDPRGEYSRKEYLRTYFETNSEGDSSEIWVAMPGDSLQYSNIGFHWLIGYIVEQISGQSIETYIQENIMAPLGMENASYEASDFQADQLATPYVRFEDGYQAMPVTGMSATGRLRTTVTDLAKFMRAHMNQGASDGVPILQPETIDLMHARNIPMSGFDFPGMQLHGSGYGWWLWEDGIQGHGGAVPGFYAQLLFKETESGSYGVVMMMNTGCSLVPCDMEWFDNYYIAIRDLLLQEAAEIYAQSADN